MTKYKHQWEGTWFQLRCAKCKETTFVGADYCDSTKAAAFVDKQQARRDCPCPPGTSLDTNGQFTMQEVVKI